ncbi:MAG: biotin synthase BioB [Odoribacter sp.]|nr:biotin synthase BioB [Odoribacter sp.]
MQPSTDTLSLTALKEKAISGRELTPDEIYSLLDAPSDQLREAAAEITAALCTRQFDSCSIVNARSGKCSENCKWCAQSAHYNTGCDTYPIISEQQCLDMARHNACHGVKRFSLVASGRAVKGEDLKKMAAMLNKAHTETGIFTCASMGLLNREELQTLWDSGVRRYHCNLETATSHFPSLCTTHTIEDKLATIATAREIGFEICSGGIIGMGETARQRAEFAIELRRARPHSIPINILSPIKGTPLQHTAPISDDEILDTIAIFRFAHPTVTLRFAGGRARLSDAIQQECMRIGINGGLVGDMLTTVGSKITDDIEAVTRAGYKF